MNLKFKNSLYLIALSLLLPTSSLLAKAGNPVTHKHGARTHTHPLPDSGLNHSHAQKRLKESSRSDIDINSASQFVVVDQSEPAFIVFTGIPKNIDKKKLEEINLKVSGLEKVRMLTWEQFSGSINEYARSVILRDDYPNIRIEDGMICLVASKQGTGAPWGLTWNGGIALTRMDYGHARQTYKLYKANPASYKPIRDPRRDPINPGGHLPFGGCYRKSVK